MTEPAVQPDEYWADAMSIRFGRLDDPEWDDVEALFMALP